MPLTRDLLDQTLPAIDDVDLETLIDQRATSLVRAIERPTDMPTVHPGGRSGYNSGSNAQSGRAQIAVQFFEKKRKKTYFFGKGDEEICWEQWTLDITCATPRTESGMFSSVNKIRISPRIRTNNPTSKDRIKVRAAMEKSLQKTCLKIINIVNRDKDHIPPITGLDNPFPYQIVVNPRSENWGARMGIF